MDMFKKTLDRAKQTVEETLGDVKPTEIDAGLQMQIVRADNIKLQMEKILSALEIYIQPDPTVRLLPGMMTEGPNKPESVGIEMSHLAAQLKGTPYGTALESGRDAYAKIGASTKECMAAANSRYLIPVRKFLHEDLRVLEQEKKILGTKRMDMDIQKGKAHRNAANAAVQEDFHKAEKAFKDQEEVLRKFIEIGVEGQLPKLHACLKELVQAQLEHLRKTQGYLEEMNTNL